MLLREPAVTHDLIKTRKTGARRSMRVIGHISSCDFRDAGDAEGRGNPRRRGFPDKKTLLHELIRLTQALTKMQTEYWDAVVKPKASRRPALATEYMETTAALLQVLDKISNQLVAAVSHSDPLVD